MATPTTRSRALTAAGLVASAGLLLTGCSMLPGSAPERDETGQITESQDNADVFAIEVGDCLNETTGTVVSSVPVVPCGEPHDEEAFFAFNLTDADLPGDDAIAEQAEATCGPEFESFIGLAYDQSTLDWYYYSPTSSSWADGDREVLCIALDPAGQVTGSLAGAAR